MAATTEPRAASALRIIVLGLVLLIDSATSTGAEMSGCSQFQNLSAARLRWAAVRKGPVGPVHNEVRCRSYSAYFFEAVTARQEASLCKDRSDRQQTLELIDSEIEAFNDLIAARCSG
jgi:hypothetical protein